MRRFVLTATLVAGIAGAPTLTLAQTSYAPPPPPMGQTPPPPMGQTPPPPTPIAPVPPGANPLTGARPGNDIGSGMSMPMSGSASNIGPEDSNGRIAPNLPSPELDENAGPMAYLRAAQGALASGRTGEAQQSLEMAQTRLLDRSVPYGQTNTPAQDPAVQRISQALQALGAGDRATCMNLIQSAMADLASSRR